MIKEIYLENWKSHEKTRIVFDKINLIIGRMGSGKTSITDAISYSLFGNFSDLNSKKIKLDDIIMKKPREKEYAKVVLNFTFENKDYEIVRIIEKNKGSYAEIRENKKIIRSGTSDTNEFIKKLLKTDFQTFINVVYAEQNRIDFFLNLEKSERKTRFDQLIGIEKLERIRKTCVSVKNRLIDIHREKERFLSQLLQENLDEKIAKIENDIKINEEKLKSLEEAKNKIKTVIEELKKKVNAGKEIKNKIEVLEKEIIEIKTKISSSKSLIEKLLSEILDKNEEYILNELSKLEEKREEIKLNKENSDFELNKLRTKREELLKEVLSFENKLKRKTELEEKIRSFVDIESEIEKIRNLEENLSKKEKAIREKMSEIEIELKKEEKVLEILSEKISICPVCETEISEDKKMSLVEKHSENINKLKEQSKKLKEELIAIEKETLELQKKYEKTLFELSKKRNIEEEYELLKEINQEKLENLKLELENLNSKIKEFENKQNVLQKELFEVDTKRKELISLKEKIEKKNKLENEIKLFEEELKKLTFLVESLKNDENYKKLEESENNLKTSEIEYEKIIKEMESIKNFLFVLNERKKEIETRIKQREKLKDEKEYLERVIKDLNILEICSKEVQIIIRSKLLDAINYFLSIYWKKLYPYRDYIDARFLASEDDYIFQLKDSLGRWIELDKVASGGERMLAAICLRIAFAKVLSPQLNIIIFDEPTHNLDEETIIQFAKIINDNFSEIFDQVFIITHDERFKSYIKANVIKVERNKIDDLPSQIIVEE